MGGCVSEIRGADWGESVESACEEERTHDVVVKVVRGNLVDRDDLVDHIAIIVLPPFRDIWLPWDELVVWELVVDVFLQGLEDLSA